MTGRPITIDRFWTVCAEVARGGWFVADVEWSEGCGPPADAEDFASEAVFVICNSGMKNTVARGIFERVMVALRSGRSARAAFGHPGKSAAIDQIWSDRETIFAGYMAAADKPTFCEALPWIGGITKYHLAKNFGAPVAKPDVHLQRLADLHGLTAQALCERLAGESGLKVATVDLVLWRACANGLLDARTGEIRRFVPADPAPRQEAFL